MENNQGMTGVLMQNEQTLTSEEQVWFARLLHYLHKKGVGDGENGQLHRARSVVIEDFLPPEDLESIRDYTIAHEKDFENSMVLKDDEHQDTQKSIDKNVRASRVLFQLEKAKRDLITNHVLKALPDVLDQLGMSSFPIGRIEAQLTASNDGDFFTLHPDSGHKSTENRRLTFVYYFNTEPKAFTGGELQVHDTILVENMPLAAAAFQTVEPRQNQIVFFPSFLMHEVLPVHCPSRSFADSRFTFNGWLHQSKKEESD